MSFEISSIDVYIFCVENGFSVSKSNEILSDLQKEGKVAVKGMDGSLARKGSFYLGYRNYKEPPKVYMERT